VTKRLFVAVWVPEEPARAVGELVAALGAREGRIRWVPPGNLHATLAFLGDVDADRVADLEARLVRSLAGAGTFVARLHGVGTFPARGDVRVVWVGFEEGTKEIAALASRAERGLAEGGFLRPDPRPYHAHVTLGRPKEARGFGRLRELLATAAFRGNAFRVEEVTLAESRLTPRGAQYEAIARFRLDGAPAVSTNPNGGESR
jgi:2'-5' RNA ligase